MDEARIRQLNDLKAEEGNVAYWMSRDQRANDNWALYYASLLAEKNKGNLFVFFALDPEYPSANFRHYDFMLRGLQEAESDLRESNIPLILKIGKPAASILSLVKEFDCKQLVADFDPLKFKRQWKAQVTDQIRIPFCEVDAHNIVPCWQVSDKEEFAAYTIRPRINRQLNRFLTEIPQVRKFKSIQTGIPSIDWKKLLGDLKFDRSVQPVTHIQPGYSQGMNTFSVFLREGLEKYNDQRNDPNQQAQSGLSPWLHFGQISAQRIALEVIQAGENEGEGGKAFLEELIVRRELSDNFCFYNHNYDNEKSFRPWAKETLNDHARDEREYLYSSSDLEGASTHDSLWNAAQMQMVLLGKMHGYMRMYWAKKILEWTKSPAEAMRIAVQLNDKYSLDGRDPNGYAGCAWSIGGIHDRAWAERPVFGKIRYMNYNGCKRKFDVDSYIQYINQIADNS